MTILYSQQDNLDLIEVSLIVEKPSIEITMKEFKVDSLVKDEFLGQLDMHALSAVICPILEGMIVKNIRQKGKIRLTLSQES
jgi:hypothetical protein